MFESKNVVLTGAAQGIGRSLAFQFADRGARVCALDRDEVGLKALAQTAKERSREIDTVTIDVTDFASLQKIAEKIHAKSPIDYWVNNAGVAKVVSFEETTPDEFDRILRVNLGAVVTATRIALTLMEKTGTGNIINMASVAGHVPCPFLTSYCTAKFAVVGFTAALREELRLKDSPVRLFMVSPGFVDTGMIEKGKLFPEWLSWMLSTPESVAEEVIHGIERGSWRFFPRSTGG